ncbi:TPA: acyltransferase [Enterobacter mori]|nr:acyltransferase [Enterobacter mori]
MRYRAEIDGLRALAVIPVILYHAGFQWLPGGFIGVDVFFVISGYLITTILINELDQGKFSIINFYERRARRILPALFVMMVVTIPFAYAYLLPDDMRSFWRSVLSVCFFVSNYLFSYESGYFAPDVELMPLLHTWSLAVEEQFYVIFPVMLFVLWRFGKSLTFFIILFIASISFMHADLGSIVDPTWTFYSITSRAWELAIGVAAAFYFRSGFSIHRNKYLSNVLGLLGISMIVYGMLYITKQTPFPGRYALLPTIGAFLIIVFSNAHNVSGKLLSLKPVVFVGLISYSAYLWHQPMMAIARHKYVVEPPVHIMVSICIATIFVAWLSWKYVEAPFRSKKGFTKSQIFKMSGAGSALFILISLIGFNSSFLNRFDGNPKYDDVANRLRGNFGLSKQCEKQFYHSRECLTADHPEILLWGDSYAMQVAGLITSSKPDVRMIQATISQCAPILGASDTKSIYGAKECIEANDKVMSMMRNTPSIKYVVIASPFERLADGGSIILRNGEVIKDGSAKYTELFKNTIAQVKAAGKTPVIVAPPVKNRSNDIGYCLMKSELVGADLDGCNFSLDAMPRVQRKVYRTLGEMSKKAKVLWITNMTCDDGSCRASQDGTLFYRDKGHLSYEGSDYLGKKYNFYKQIVN